MLNIDWLIIFRIQFHLWKNSAKCILDKTTGIFIHFI
jgi:hypothetical protein